MNNNDVDLDALLGIESVDNTTNEPRLDNSAEDNSSAATETATNERESKRENDRIRTLLEENKRLKESQNTEPDLDSFLSNIQDEGTRNLLKEYGKVMQNTIDKQYKPVLSDYKEAQFEKEFADMQSIFPNLSAHKEEMMKDFSRNPNANLKSMVGNLIIDLQKSKIKPLESKASQSPRDEVTADLNSASKDDLYAMLKAKKN